MSLYRCSRWGLIFNILPALCTHFTRLDPLYRSVSLSSYLSQSRKPKSLIDRVARCNDKIPPTYFLSFNPVPKRKKTLLSFIASGSGWKFSASSWQYPRHALVVTCASLCPHSLAPSRLLRTPHRAQLLIASWSIRWQVCCPRAKLIRWESLLPQSSKFRLHVQALGLLIAYIVTFDQTERMNVTNDNGISQPESYHQ